MSVMQLVLTAFFESYRAFAPSDDERWGIEEVVTFLAGMDASSEEALHDGIAGLLRTADTWRAESLISDEAYRPFGQLQQQYELLCVLRERLQQQLDLLFGLPVPPSGTVDEAGTPEVLLAWRVQPEESPQINYAAFEAAYGCTRPQIDALIALVGHYHPGAPILNRTVEWAARNLRAMEGLNMPASK